MGADLSKYEQFSLVSYASNPLAILDPAYVHDGLKPLHLTLDPDTSLLSTGEWKIHTGNGANVLFTTHTNMRDVNRVTVTLLDTAHDAKPLCTFACDSMFASREYTIYRGPAATAQAAMDVKVRSNKGELEFEVQIKCSGEVVWVKTSKRGKMMYVFSGYPQVGAGEGQEPSGGDLIAKSSIRSSGKMEAQVSVGVDRVAMVGLLLLVEFVRREERKFSIAA